MTHPSGQDDKAKEPIILNTYAGREPKKAAPLDAKAIGVTCRGIRDAMEFELRKVMQVIPQMVDATAVQEAIEHAIETVGRLLDGDIATLRGVRCVKCNNTYIVMGDGIEGATDCVRFIPLADMDEFALAEIAANLSVGDPMPWGTCAKCLGLAHAVWVQNPAAFP
jgi:hypothetical protein